MDSSPRKNQQESLNDSWVELHFQQAQGPDLIEDVERHSAHNGDLERLLIEAQRDSSRSSKENSNASSSRGSPNGPNSPTEHGTDWIWDWSSRMESQPPSIWPQKYRHPSRHRLSVRKSSVMKSPLFSLENLPTLFVTHACTLFLGAAAMFLYLKKCCNWAAVTTTAK